MKILLPALLFFPLLSCKRGPVQAAIESGIRKAGLPEEVVHLPQFEGMQRHAVLNFEASQGLGNSRLILSRHPADGEILTDQNGVKWRVELFQLVSLLEHDPPKAYISAHESTHGGTETFKQRKKYYDEHRDVTDNGYFNVRELEVFEMKAVRALRKDASLLPGDALSGRKDGKMHFLGAITAEKDCLKCHEGKREGDLLGAFTWGLSPVERADAKIARSGDGGGRGMSFSVNDRTAEKRR